ncbi:hypothetical protein AB1Y20_009723 [Prymnesium parvum]|uniref:Uncharacterized protein n=1 Tax=Prymnesium parvum TaxID=97485 RepID=A0AB34K5X0_PRYPA
MLIPTFLGIVLYPDSIHARRRPSARARPECLRVQLGLGLQITPHIFSVRSSVYKFSLEGTCQCAAQLRFSSSTMSAHVRRKMDSNSILPD